MNRAMRRAGWLEPKDIEKPGTKSGYSHVRKVDAKTSKGHGGGKPYQAEHGHGKPGKPKWFGPRRKTAIEAAQDYCDYVNGSFVKSLTNNYPTITVDTGTTKHTKGISTVIVKREKYVGPCDLYDVLFYDGETGVVFRRKIGVTWQGDDRWMSLAKTLGLCVTVFNKAVTYPSEAAARVAEDLRIAEAQKQFEWRQVSKEAFAPTADMKVGQ